MLGTFLSQDWNKTLAVNPQIIVCFMSNIIWVSERIAKREMRIGLPHSIAFLQAFVAKASICLVPTIPLDDSSSKASTTASPTVSTFSGFSAIEPRNPSLFPRKVLTSDVRNPPRAIGRVNFRLESYMKPGLMKILRKSGRVEAIVSSASLLVVMYRAGRIGAPPAAEMYTNAGTCSVRDSCANAIAVSQDMVSFGEASFVR